MNVITIFVDTLRYDHVLGDVDVETPNFDRLAARSWRFHRAFPSSFPTIPHRTDALTGRYGAPFHPWAPLDCDVPTLPGALADAGYVTQLIHDTPHLVNGGHRFDYPFQAWTPVRGGEVDRAWLTDDWSLLDNWAFDPLYDEAYASGPGEGHDGRDPRNVEAVLTTGHVLPRYVHTNRHRETEADWNAAKLFDTAADFVRDNADRENFFLWLDCFDPHEPWDAPARYVEEYADGGTIDPRSFIGWVRNHPDLPEAANDQMRAQYRAKVAFVDRWLGELLDELEATGLRDETAILLAGDHGTNVGGPRGFGKDEPPAYGESHVPALLDVPDAGSGDCDALVQTQDVFATVAGLAGASVPEAAESHDMLAAARERHSPRDVALTGGSVDNWEGRGPEDVLFHATDGEWSLAVTADPTAGELRRLDDPGETVADPDAAATLHGAALDEIEDRGLDDPLAEWLRAGGAPAFPEEYRVTDAGDAPAGWRPYFQEPTVE